MQVNDISEKKFTQSSLVEREKAKLKAITQNHGVFLVKPANQWLKDASEKPMPKPLFMCVWHEGEVCILYAETNTGKSILAIQIANEISQSQVVIVFDFELSDKQFEARYSDNFTNHYSFNKNFYRAEINPDEADYKAAGFNCLEDYIEFSIEKAIEQTGAKVLIIDNITYLRSETEKAKDALPLMKRLKEIKNKHELSILVLAHTPKRDHTKPITRNDLQGSKMLINFCDSAFAIGESAKDKRLRYLKQIKSRSAEIVYDTDYVQLFEVGKSSNFLMFTPVHTGNEREHLKQYTKEDKEHIINQCIELSSKGKSQRDISFELGISLGAVNKYVRSRSPQGMNTMNNES